MRNKFRNKRKFFFIIPVVILFAVTGVVMWLWNGILPDVTGVGEITYWQAMGILVLSKILFGGFGGFRKHRGGWHKERMKEKFRNMSPEERENFKQQWRERFARKGFCKE
jgi:hypothetical protein